MTEQETEPSGGYSQGAQGQMEELITALNQEPDLKNTNPAKYKRLNEEIASLAQQAEAEAPDKVRFGTTTEQAAAGQEADEGDETEPSPEAAERVRWARDEVQRLNAMGIEGGEQFLEDDRGDVSQETVDLLRAQRLLHEGRLADFAPVLGGLLDSIGTSEDLSTEFLTLVASDADERLKQEIAYVLLEHVDAALAARQG